MYSDSEVLLTQELLKEALHYNPETGIFTRLTSPSNSVKVGDTVGNLTQGYLAATLNRRRYRLHRLAFLYMEGRWPAQIDHIDHVRDNNVWANLREVTPTENKRNTGLALNNTSGTTGVSWCAKQRKWRASIKIARKVYNLGRFKTKAEAIAAREAANKIHNFHANHGT